MAKFKCSYCGLTVEYATFPPTNAQGCIRSGGVHCFFQQ
jgi:hypothetical protein